MIRIKCHNQRALFDEWAFLGDKRRKLLSSSWAFLFREHLLQMLPVREMMPFFSQRTGRPTKELYTVLGTLLLQQVHDLTDLETVEALAFNIQWHYALNLTEDSDSAKYLCPKTLWSMRRILVENALEQVLFDRTSRMLSKVFSVDTAKQRLDSVHIRSNMARLGRIRIFAHALHAFLKNLKRHYPEDFGKLDSALVNRYFDKQALGCFSMVKPSASAATLSVLSSELFDLVRRFEDHEAISRMRTFLQLKRILSEQCRVVEDTVEVKASKEVPSDSLQNPSDPDAGYSAHKGQGYQIQIMETYQEKTPEDPRPSLNLITHVAVEPAHHHDSTALIPAIESATQRGFYPQQVLADALYGSDENLTDARTKGVELISPVMGEKPGKILITDFAFDDTHHVLTCPMGHAPVKQKMKKGRYSVAFAKERCAPCPHVASCPVKASKRYFYLRFEEKHLRLDQRRAMEKTDAFQERYRYRAGIEATFSEYDRKTRVKRLRVRGLEKVRFCAVLKAVGVNLFRAARVWVQRTLEKGGILAKSRPNSRSYGAFWNVKERFDAFFNKFCAPVFANADDYLKPAQWAA